MKKILLICASLFVAISAFSQERIVTGKVSSKEDGSVVPGVSIALKGTANGTVTDVNGDYKLSVPQEGGILVFSYIGKKTQEEEIGTRNVVDLQLSDESSQLQEVIVTGALGIQHQEKEIGYAATVVSSAELTQAKAVDIAQSLNGKVSGVNISTTNSGVFQNYTIKIRGVRSLTGNNQPMLVVDGAQVPLSTLTQIAPGDIETTTILKSGASAALYGSDAVNGVIVLTTKRGRPNAAPVINISSSYQVAKVAYFPKLQHNFGAGAGETSDQYGNYNYVPFENQIFGPRFDGTTRDIGVRLQDGSIQSGPYSNLHKNDKIKFWNSGSTFQNTVSMTGNDYFLSISDANIKGLMPEDVNRRTVIRYNGNKKVNKFTVAYGVGFTMQNSNVVNEAQLQNLYQGSYSGSIMFAVLQTPDNVPLLSYKNQNNKFAQYSNYYNEFALPPYWIINNMRSKSRSQNLLSNVTLGYQIAPWLAASVRVNSNLSSIRTENDQNPLVVSDWALANRNSTQYFNAKGAVFNDYNYNSLFNIDYNLNGKTNVTKDLTVSYLAGGNYRQTTGYDVAVGGNNLVDPGIFNVSVRSGDAIVPTYNNSSNGIIGNYNYNLNAKRASVYGQLGFGFKDWAFIDATARNDWDSRLAPANRSFFYPAVNASLVLSDAIKALKSPTLTYLKVRGAYSQNGNVNVPIYSLSSTYSPPTGFPFGNNVGFTAGSTIPSNNLKPETVISKEVGIEIGVLDGRLDFEATYFDQDCQKQVLTTTLPISTGYSYSLANAAQFTNKGVELDLGISPYQIGRGAISFKINATYNTNQITSTQNNAPVVLNGTSTFTQTANGSPTANNIGVVGGPAFQFQLSDYNRDPSGKVIVDAVTGNPSQAADLKVMGRSLPLWIMGFTPRYTIGGFSVSMTWDYKTGNQFYSGLGSDMDFSGISARSASYGRQRFVMPNSVIKNADGTFSKNTNIQVQDGNYGFWTGSSTNTGIATNYFANATAFRLRELNITYNLPNRWLANTFIKKVSISAVGRNLFLFVPKSNQWGDPEFNNATTQNTSGVSGAFQTPSSRLYGGSINITL